MADDHKCCHEQFSACFYCCYRRPFFGGKLHRCLCLPVVAIALEKWFAPTQMNFFANFFNSFSVFFNYFFYGRCDAEGLVCLPQRS